MKLGDARTEYIRWLQATRDLSGHTIRAYDGDAAELERHLGRGFPVTELDRDHAVAFLEVQRSRGLAPVTIRRRVCGIRGMFRWMVAYEILVVDPWFNVSLPASRRRRLPRNVPDDCLRVLIQHLCDRARVSQHSLAASRRLVDDHATTLLAVALMLVTGVRVAEATAIRSSDVDLSRRSVRINGKGSRERQVYLTNDWITDLTGLYLSNRNEQTLDHDQLLVNRRMDPLTPSALRERLRRAALDAGIRSNVTPHMLRHSAATKLVDAGVDIRLIQALLGHASLTTTEIYTHVSNRALRRAVTEADVLGGSLLIR